MYHATFKFKFTYQNYVRRNKKLIPKYGEYGPYDGEVERLFIEGDEDSVWRDIQLKLGDSRTKKVNILDKKIINLQDVGKTVK